MNLPTFDVDESKFQIWWERFQYYARLKILVLVLETQVNTQTPDVVYEDLLSVQDPEEAQKKIIKAVSYAVRFW